MNNHESKHVFFFVAIAISFIGGSCTTAPESMSSVSKAEQPRVARPMITGFQFSPDSGALFVGTFKGRIRSVGVSGVNMGGAVTHFNGSQTFRFRSATGESYICPGRIYVGLSKSPNGEITGGLDWAFIVGNDVTLPDWVELLAKDIRERAKQNVFLGNFSDIIKSDKRILFVGPMGQRENRWVPELP
jgi:hypothetical protein